LVARSEQVLRLTSIIKANEYATLVCTPSTMPSEALYDRVVCVSWLGGTNIDKIASTLVALSITFLAYDFETEWLKQYSRDKRRYQLPNALTATEKRTILSRVVGADV